MCHFWPQLMLNFNTYQIKWYPDSLFDLFVVNLKAYFSPLLLFYRLNTATSWCIYWTPPVFLTCSLTYQRKNSRWLAVMASNINDRRVIMYSLFVQLKTKSAMIQYQRPKRRKRLDEHNMASMTFWRLWRNGFADVTKGIDVKSKLIHFLSHFVL